MESVAVKSKFPQILFIIYLILFSILSFNPIDRPTWFVENLTVWIIVGIIIVLYRRGIRFSNTAYFLMSILVYLHTIGGHYTFALVPFDWFTDFFDFERNHYDRIAHFSVGFYAYAIAEWIKIKNLVANHFLLFTYPLFAITFIAAGYELIEWGAAMVVSPEAGNAYLGTQGDIWDAQKDIALDMLGAIVILIFFFFKHRLFRKEDF